MRPVYRVLLVISLIFVLIAIGLWIFLEAHKPYLNGEVELARVQKPVNIWYDKYGIPHIYADNAEDAYRAFGYVHAQDRLFQMELMRRVGAGRLAEIFGSEFSKVDGFFRTLGTNRQAAADAARFETLPDEVKLATRAYLDGINQYMEEGMLPLEYKFIGIEAEPYDVEDLYCIAGYMAYSFALALRTDPLVEFMNNNLDPNYLIDLDPSFRPDTLERETTESIVPSPIAHISAPHLLDQLPVPVFQGSNSWAIAPQRTASGKAMLANDTHIKFAAPAVWYEAHIVYPGFELYGNFLAGVPFALVGHNRAQAWGITMFEDDDSDFFTEKFTESDSTSTQWRDSLTAPVTKYTEIIKVRNAPDTTITVYETGNGVIINAYLPVPSQEPVSMFWNYTNFETNLLEAFYQMNHAGSMEKFKLGVSQIGSPGLNVSYADSSGNIALWSASKLVKRPEGVDGKMYSRGYASADAFDGYLPFAVNPATVNPDRGYLYTANESHPNTDSTFYPGYYVPDTRAERIEKFMSDKKLFYLRYHKDLILDAMSITEARTAHEIAAVLNNVSVPLSENEVTAVSILSNWDGDHQLQDIAPTIYYKVLYHILAGAMKDEFGENVFKEFLQTHLFSSAYPRLLTNDHSVWWDNKETKDQTENRGGVFYEALKISIGELEDQLGEDPEAWKWERVHTVEHPHPLGTVSVLRGYFNVGPFPAPGGRETINNAGFTLNPDGIYEVSYGPAMRRIIDFSDIENAISVLPTGNSGNVMSRHYSDQARLFVEGRFRPMMINKKEIKKSANKLVIKGK